MAASSSSSSSINGMLRPASMKRPAPTSSGTSAAEAAAAAEFASKKYVWVPDAEVGYRSAWVISEEKGGEETVVAMEDGTQRTVASGDVSRQNPPRFELSENIADLTFLSEAGVSHCLRQRYQRGLIYTYSGLFLVAVNPYHQLPIYTDAVVAAYKGRRREENAPHVFAVADEAMRNMLDTRENQSLLVTGESGAGKTENTKKVIQYLAAVAADMAAAQGSNDAAEPGMPRSNSSMPNALSRSGSSRYVLDRLEGLDAVGPKRLGLLERQILQANPILEAFGNAQTIRNNNSSRFGKFVRIEFTSLGAIAGANIDWYLLEKSRVHNRSEQERSFHVFYQLLRSGDRALLDRLLLTGNPTDYVYLKSTRQNVEGLDDGEDWKTLKSALDTVGFVPDEQNNFFRVVAAILQIGNIELADDRSEQARITNSVQVEKVCHLLGVPEQELTKALLRPRVKAGREWVTQSRTRKQVADELAALCKTMYEKTFAAIVERINQALDRPTSKSTFIGVLDIAGFEIFETNSFEQLCINYTNEKLQQFFNHHMFVLEQEEYARENIEWDFVNFGLDLQPTIDLIESTTPVGILSCLDEECIMPKATDVTFTEKCNTAWASKKDGTAKDAVAAAAAAERGVAHGSTKYMPSRFATGFTIKHYAGDVEYRTDGWLDKNKDPLNSNLTRVMYEASDRFISGLFAEFAPEDETALAGPPTTPGPKRRVKRGAFRTLAQKHKEQLTSLMNQLGSTQPHFVRCIVPNSERKPGKMQLPLVLEQLRCNGVLEGIRIARLGYPNRLLFTEFRTRYEILTPDIIPRGYMDGRKACQRMVEAMALDRDVFKIGVTKIFFKSGVLAELEERRDALLYDVFARFQAAARMFTARRQMKKILNRAAAVRTIQRNARLYVELRDWPWWQLYSKVRPLLKATRHDEELKRKEMELALITERAQRDQKEREALEALRAGLESEKQKIEQDLASERSLLAEKDQQLTRSRERESTLEDDLAAMQKDVDQLDDQLERALAAQRDAEAARAELQTAFDQAAEHLIRLEAAEKDWKSREVTLNSDIAHHKDTHTALSVERDTLLATKVDLENRVRAGNEDLDRHQKRLASRVTELEAQLAGEQEGRSGEQAKIARLEDESRKREYQLSELTRSSTAIDETLKQKQQDVASLQAQLERATKDKADLAAEVAAQKAKVQSLSAEAQTSRTEIQKAQEAREQLQRELDETRRLMDAKTSEDVKQREVSRMKEEELSGLRQQLASAQAQLADSHSKSSEKLASLGVQLDAAQKQYAEASTAHRDASVKLDEHAKRVKELSSALEVAERGQRQALNERDSQQERASTAEAALTAQKTARSDAEKQLSAMQAELQEVEDALCECERSQSAWQKQAEELGAKLDAELQERHELEGAAKRDRAAAEAAKRELAAKEKDHARLREDHALLLGDLKKAQSMSNKTIVEHVHVLREAKNKTDGQLAEAQTELEKLSRINASLEKIKGRLTSENEDLTRENARLSRQSGSQSQSPTVTYGNIGGSAAGGSVDKSSLRQFETKIAELTATARDAKRERDEALSKERRSHLSLESMREQYEARIIDLERQLETSHLAHSNTFHNLQDLVQESSRSDTPTASSTSAVPESPFKRRLLKELQDGHQALEADIAAKSQLLRSQKVTAGRRSGGLPSPTSGPAASGQPSWAVPAGAPRNGTSVVTPSAMKRASTDVGAMANKNAAEETQRLQRQVKEMQIDVASLTQNAADAEHRAGQWRSVADETGKELARMQQYAQQLERQLNAGSAPAPNGMYSTPTKDAIRAK
ncbi:unnamed protein product [Parajaminaea phylloscopi]